MPAPMPKTVWLKTTDDMCEAPRARSPKTAEAKISPPPRTSTTIKSSNGLSIPRLRLMLSRSKRNDDAEERKHGREHPVAHHDLISRPAEGLEMVMQRRDAKKLISEIFFGNDLRVVRCNSHNKKRSDDRKRGDANTPAKVVCHEGDRRNSERKRHRARIAHVETRWRNVKPEERENPAHDRGRKRGEVDLVLGK